MSNTTARPRLPPFDAESAALKVRRAEDAWNRRDPEKVSLAYTPDSIWRNRVTIHLFDKMRASGRTGEIGLGAGKTTDCAD